MRKMAIRLFAPSVGKNKMTPENMIGNAPTGNLLDTLIRLTKERDDLLKSRAEHCAAVELYADRALQAEQKNLKLQELAQKIANQHSNHCVLGCQWEPETINQATELGIELE